MNDILIAELENKLTKKIVSLLTLENFDKDIVRFSKGSYGTVPRYFDLIVKNGTLEYILKVQWEEVERVSERGPVFVAKRIEIGLRNYLNSFSHNMYGNNFASIANALDLFYKNLDRERRASEFYALLERNLK